MRNAVPPLAFVQEVETSLAGPLGVGIEGSNSTIPGDDMYHTLSSNTLTLPPLSPYGVRNRYIDIFSRGTKSCSWKVTPWEQYVNVTPSSGTTGGTNGTDARIYLTVSDWSSIPAGNSSLIKINVTTSDCTWGSTSAPTIILPLNRTTVLANFTGFVEDDAYVAIEAAHATLNTSSASAHYVTIPNYGRTLSGVTLFPFTAPSQPLSTAPYLQYDFYSFTPTNSTSPGNITLHLSPNLNFNSDVAPLRYAIAIDEEAPQVVQFVSNTTGGALPVGWLDSVADAIWGVSGNSTTTQHIVPTGGHRLRIWALDVGVVLQRIIIDLGGVRQSYLGPPESEWVSGLQ